MRQVQGSRLVLLTHEGSHRERTLNFLAKEGIDRPRIEFTSPRPRRDYLALYEGIDISLDSFPYNGHTTGLDSLWMGVPIITLSGPTPVSRAGTSLLSNLGLTDLIAQSADRFVQKATELASDLPKLQSVRSTLRQRMQQSPLMDAPRFARSVEGAYRHIWRDWCAAPFLPTN
jgi:predicted O-linked N-acetylglucosamine transferase (SPINDLY family)